MNKEIEKQYLKEMNEAIAGFTLEFKRLAEEKKNMSKEEYEKRDKDLALRIAKTTTQIKQKYGKS